MLHWTVWNETVFGIETGLSLNWIVIYRTVLNWIRTVWLNWIAWNRNIFDKLCTHAKLNCLK